MALAKFLKSYINCSEIIDQQDSPHNEIKMHRALQDVSKTTKTPSINSKVYMGDSQSLGLHLMHNNSSINSSKCHNFKLVRLKLSYAWLNFEPFPLVQCSREI